MSEAQLSPQWDGGQPVAAPLAAGATARVVTLPLRLVFELLVLLLVLLVFAVYELDELRREAANALVAPRRRR